MNDSSRDMLDNEVYGPYADSLIQMGIVIKDSKGYSLSEDSIQKLQKTLKEYIVANRQKSAGEIIAKGTLVFVAEEYAKKRFSTKFTWEEIIRLSSLVHAFLIMPENYKYLIEFVEKARRL